MNANLAFKYLVAIALLISLSSIAKEDDRHAPEYGEFSTKDISSSFEQAIPELKDGFIDLAPSDRKDGISVGELGIDGGKKEMIAKLANEIAEKQHGLYDSMLISYKDKLIFESYYSRGRINLPHSQASTTKSYTALAIGRAIQLGYLSLADLDKPLVNFLKELDTEKFADGAQDITLHQVMNMRSGIRINDEQSREIRKKPYQQSNLGQVQAMLELSKAISQKSRVFKYQSGDPIITMHVLDAVVPGSANDFINNELFAKMGISVYGWQSDVVVVPKGYSGSSLTSRDMLKLGTLIINKGKWNDEQLISQEFMAKATSRYSYPKFDWIPKEAPISRLSYGYFMWRTDMKVGDKFFDCKFAWGGGGQYILTLEELDLTVVITAHDREDRTLVLAPEVILAAFVQL